MTYKDAGVDIDAGNALVERIKPWVSKTHRAGVLTDIGGFGGLFALDRDSYPDPVLVSGTDGVGTKLKLARMLNRHDTIGIDLVAMCVNDVVVQGAEPLFFLDYFATGRLDPAVAESVVSGIATGCQQAGCALIGGETAEMPDMYADGDYDLAGFNVGVVNRDQIITGELIREGSVILGVDSSGPHSNGYSLIRKILSVSGADLEQPLGHGTLGSALIEPTRIYVKPALELLRQITVLGFAHITGGGLRDNIIRVVPEGLGIDIDLSRWQWPEVFRWLQQAGEVSTEEMLTTFNCGIGFCVLLEPSAVERATAVMSEAGWASRPIGTVRLAGDQPVRFLSA